MQEKLIKKLDDLFAKYPKIRRPILIFIISMLKIRKTEDYISHCHSAWGSFVTEVLIFMENQLYDSRRFQMERYSFSYILSLFGDLTEVEETEIKKYCQEKLPPRKYSLENHLRKVFPVQPERPMLLNSVTIDTEILNSRRGLHEEYFSFIFEEPVSDKILADEIIKFYEGMGFPRARVDIGIGQISFLTDEGLEIVTCGKQAGYSYFAISGI